MIENYFDKIIWIKNYIDRGLCGPRYIERKNMDQGLCRQRTVLTRLYGPKTITAEDWFDRK